MQNGIPLYTADGELGDWISEKRMARLERPGLIQIIRHRKGRVARCILHRRPGDPKPVRLTDYLGTWGERGQQFDIVFPATAR